MIYAETATEVDKRHKTFMRKRGLKCKAVAYSLEEVGNRLLTLTWLDLSRWNSAQTTDAIERLNEEFRRRTRMARRPALDTITNMP